MSYTDNNLIEHTVEDNYVVLNNRMDIDYILTEAIVPAVKIDLDFFPPLVADSGNIIIDGHKSEIVNPSSCKVSSPEIEVHGHEVTVYLNPDKIFLKSGNVRGEPLEALISISPAGCESISPDTTAPIDIVDPDGLRAVSPGISIIANNTIVTVNPDKVFAATSAADAFSISRPVMTEGIIVFVSPGKVEISSPYPSEPVYDNYPEGDVPDTFENAFDIGLLWPGADYNYSQMLGGDSDINDWYKFTISGAATVSVKIVFDSRVADFDLELYNSGGDELAASWGSSDTERVQKFLSPGTYYIKANSYYGTTEYQLNIHVSGSFPGSFPIPDGAKAITVFVGDIFNGQPGIIHHKILPNFNGVWFDTPAFILNHNILPAFGEFVIPETVPYSVIYNCILTGSQNGVEDLILPLKNFQTRLRDGEPTYCGIVVPDVERYMDGILKRKNGEIVIQRGVHYNSGEKNFVELVRVDFEEIGYDRGIKNNSLSLSGHKTTRNVSPKTVKLKKIQSETLQKNGRYRIRSDVDFFTKPGDTIVWGENTNSDNDNQEELVGDASNTREGAFDIGVLGPGGEYTHTQTLGGSDDKYDWYKFTILETRIITVELLFQHSLSDMDMYLDDSENNRLEYATSSSDNELIETSLSAGTYYICVDQYSGGVVEYTLNISASGTPPPPEPEKFKLSREKSITVEMITITVGSRISTMDITGL